VLLLVTGILLFFITVPVWAAGEDDFWITWRQGDYNKAGNLAKDLGSTIPEYYSLAAICYQNSYQYDLFRIYKNKFRQLASPDRLKELLANQQNVSPDDPQILFLQGITAILFPEAKIGDPSILFEKAAIKLNDNPYFNNYWALVEINNHNYSLAVQKYLQKSISLKNFLLSFFYLPL
jgi:hypothetical protein